MGKSHLIVSMYLDLGLDFMELDGASPLQVLYGQVNYR